MRQTFAALLLGLLAALTGGMAHALSLDTLSVQELYSHSEIVIEAEVVGPISPEIDGVACGSLTQLKVVNSYKGNLSAGTVISAWGYFEEQSSGQVIAFIRTGSPDYAPNHPLGSPESLSTEPRMLAWKRCSNAIPYSVIFYGIAILPIQTTLDLSGEVGVLFPKSFIVPPENLGWVPSSVPSTSATRYFWVLHKSIADYIRSLSN